MPRPHHRHVAPAARRLFAIAWLSGAVLALASPSRAQLTLPTDFVDDLILGGLNQSVGMAFLADGRLLFVERTTARVRLIVNGAIAATDPLITVPTVNTAGQEQGLLGIAPDPGWPARPYLYLHYDYSGSPTIRISRYTVAGDLAFTGNGSLTIDPATRYDILTDIPDNASNHNGGTVRFGPDGMLYISLGDDAISCQGQLLTVLAGKILRLDVSALPAGGGGPPAKSLITPADNPYVAHANANARLVGYWGLRNPFRFGIDPVTGSLVIGDVGQSAQEELSHVSVLGRNLQWPIYEGELGGPTSCAGVDSTAFTDPIHVYGRTEGRSVIGGAIYRRPATGVGRFPPEYEGDIFFTDFYSGWVRRLKKSGSTWALAPAAGQPNASDWATGGLFVSDWLEAPDGSLWYCRMLSGGGSGPGQLRRIRYIGTASVPVMPGASIDFRPPFPSPTSGTVSFAYTLVAPARVGLAIFDLAGRHVRTIIEPETQGTGPHGAVWDGLDWADRMVGPSVFLAVLTVDGRRFERRFAVIR